jgi:hypothetical protein
MRLQLDTQVGQTGSAAAVPSSGLSGGRARTAGSEDSVSVSTLSATLSGLASSHSARLQQIAGALANDSYRVPGSAIAGAITGYTLAAE